MTVLLILIIPFVFVLYAVFSKDATGTFTAFIIGVFAALLSLLIYDFLPMPDLSKSPYFWTQTWRFFSEYFLIHTILGLALLFLMTFSISGEVLDTVSSGLFGIFSVVFANIAYQSINVPVITERILLLLVIVGSILIFDFIFNILISTLTISLDFVVFLISSLSLFLAFFGGSMALASYYLTSSMFTALIITGSIFLVGIILNVILSRLN